MGRESIPLLLKSPEEPNDTNSSMNSSLPLILRWKGTVILQTWWQILLVVLYSAGVVFVHFNVDQFKLDFPQALIDILGIVTGLLLAFRTQTAYERYSEGRLLWSQMTLNIRNLTRYIWVGVKNHDAKNIVEKKSAINLLIAFAVATKHYLREEYSYEFEDLRSLIPHIKSFHIPSSNVPISYQDIQHAEKIVNHFNGDTLKAHDVVTPTNIPIELSYYIESFINYCEDQKKCADCTIASMRTALSNLVECLTQFERILRTPIPLAYSVHLHHMTWLYIVAMPMQLVEHSGWWTVPIVGIATFSFLGILEIGWEIENPFGYDANDLPLDDFCKVIRREIERVIMRGPMSADEWIYSDQNCPLIPKSYLKAQDLLFMSADEIGGLISNNRCSFSSGNGSVHTTGTNNSVVSYTALGL